MEDNHNKKLLVETRLRQNTRQHNGDKTTVNQFYTNHYNLMTNL